eukprot:SAG31_NODE_4479_length_3200_cov_2.358916_3_plen_211_part_00
MEPAPQPECASAEVEALEREVRVARAAGDVVAAKVALERRDALQSITAPARMAGQQAVQQELGPSPALSEAEQKQQIGEAIYPLVQQRIGAQWAGKVTGMLLSAMPNDQLLGLVDSAAALEQSIDECMGALNGIAKVTAGAALPPPPDRPISPSTQSAPAQTVERNCWLYLDASGLPYPLPSRFVENKLAINKSDFAAFESLHRLGARTI